MKTTKCVCDQCGSSIDPNGGGWGYHLLAPAGAEAPFRTRYQEVDACSVDCLQALFAAECARLKSLL